MNILPQPFPLAFDPEKLTTEDPIRLMFERMPTAAFLWMAFGVHHLRSQYYTVSCIAAGACIDFSDVRNRKAIENILRLSHDPAMAYPYGSDKAKRDQFFVELLAVINDKDQNVCYTTPDGRRNYLWDISCVKKGVHPDDIDE